jgi:hypothetical protein
MKRRSGMKKMRLTPSRKAKLIVFKVLEYAEAGGMAAEDCGITYEALSNCLDCVGKKPDEALVGLIDQIDTIIDSDVWMTE